MAVKKSKPIYETTDGREYTDEAAALAHEERVTLQRDYERARTSWCTYLAEQVKTADGYGFKFGVFSDYWYISNSWRSAPDMVSVYFLRCGQYRFEEDGEFEIVKTVHDTGRNVWREERYKVSGLYKRKENARAALIVAREAWLVEQRNELDALRAETNTR